MSERKKSRIEALEAVAKAVRNRIEANVWAQKHPGGRTNRWQALLGAEDEALAELDADFEEDSVDRTLGATEGGL